MWWLLSHKLSHLNTHTHTSLMFKIVNVSPAPIHYEETLNTLKYANRAKNIKTRAVANSVQVDLHVTQYTRIISELRHKIALLESSASSSTSDVTMDKIPIPPSSVTTAPTSTSTYQHIFDPALLESSLVHIQGIMSKYFQKITQKSLESAAAQVAIDMNELRVSHLKSILALVSKATTTTPSTHIAITQDSRVSSLREQILKSIDDLHTANAALRHVVSREEFAVCQMDEKMLSKIDKIKVQLVVKKTSTSSSPHQPQQLQPLLNNPLDDDIAKRMNIQWSMLKNIVFDRKQAITKECYSTCLLQIESFTSVAFHLIYSDEASLLDLWQIVQEIVSSPPLFCGTTAGQIVPVTAETDILDVMSEGDASFCSSVAPGGFGDEDGDGLVMKTGVGGVGVIDEMDDVDVDIMPVIEESLFNACRDTVGVGVGSEPAIVRKISSLSLHATPNTTIPAVADEDAGEDDDGGKTPSTVKAIKSRNLLEQENTNNIQQHSPVPPTSEFISDQHELEQLHPSLKRKKTIGSNSIADNINNNHNNSSNSARKSKKARVTIYSTSRSGRHHHHSKNSRLHDDFSGAEADVSKAENETDEDLAANDDSSTDEYIATIGGKNENTTPTLSRMAANAAAVNGLDKIIGNFMKNPVVTSGSGALVKKGSVHNVPTPLPVKFVFSPKIMPGTSLSSSMSLTASQAALMASPRVQASFGSTSLTAASSSVNTAPTSDSSSSGAGPIRCSPARRDKRNNHRSSMIPILKGNGSPLTTPFVANNTNGGGGVGSPLVPKAAAGGASTVTRRGITFYSPKVLRSSASSRIMRGSSTSGGGGGGSHSPSKSNKQRVSSLHLSSSLKASSSRKPAAASSSTASNPFTSSSSSSSIVKKQPQPQHQQQQILRKHKSTPSMRPRKESTSTATTDQEPMYSRESSVAAASDAESFKGVGNVKRITRSTAITGSTGRVGLLGGSGLNRRK